LLLSTGAVIIGVYYCVSKNEDYKSLPSFLQWIALFQKNKKDDETAMDMDESPGYVQAEDHEKPRKKPSKDAPFRWGLLVIFLAINIPALLAVIVMVAFP